MIIIGLDPHPDTHTVAALNPNGRVLASTTLLNTPEGLKELRRWATQFPERRWAVEGAGNRFLSSWVTELSEPYWFS
jgi:transposase